MSTFENNIAKAEAYLARFRARGVLNHIDGEAVPAADGTTFDIISPVDLKVLAKVAHAWRKIEAQNTAEPECVLEHGQLVAGIEDKIACSTGW